jgi:D-serine dehydratase
VRYPRGADIRVGDLFALGISHPCTAFDKWDVLYRVDEEFNVLEALKTFF